MMKSKLNILHISPDFNYVCGVSKYLTIIFSELHKNENVNLFFITNGGDSTDRLKNLKVNLSYMKFKKGLENFIYLRKNLNELEKFCRQNEIDIIHTHHRYPELLANLLKKKLNIKTVTTVHSLVSGFKYLSFKSDIIIAVSKSVEKNIMQNYNVSKERIIQMYNPINFDEYEICAKINLDKSYLGLSEDSKVFTYIGRWSKDKGVDRLIKVFNEIFKSYKNVYLIIISNLPIKTSEKIQKLNSNFKVVSPLKDIINYYKISDTIILPSKRESFPFVMLEAGLFRKLFIGSKVDGIDEFIDNELDGFLFELNCKSFQDVVEKTLKLSKEKENFLIDNLFKKVNRLDNPESYTNKLISIYQKLLDGK